MPLRNSPIVPSTASMVRVDVFSYSNGEISGRLHSIYLNQSQRFESVLDMTKCMERWFDAVTYPQSTVEFRRFPAKKQQIEREKHAAALSKEEPAVAEEEKLLSFIIHVKSRRSATWQGVLLFAPHEKGLPFRSVLELVKIIDKFLFKT